MRRGQVDGHAPGQACSADRGLAPSARAAGSSPRRAARRTSASTPDRARRARGSRPRRDQRPSSAHPVRCAPTRPRRRGPPPPARTPRPRSARARRRPARSRRRCPACRSAGSAPQGARPRGDVRGLATRGEADLRGRVAVRGQRSRGQHDDVQDEIPDGADREWPDHRRVRYGAPVTPAPPRSGPLRDGRPRAARRGAARGPGIDDHHPRPAAPREHPGRTRVRERPWPIAAPCRPRSP